MKKLISLILVLISILTLVGCNNNSMNTIVETKSNVTGIVQEVHDDYIVMYSDTAKGYPNGSRWSISLNVENKDSYTDLVIGDEIVVYYDGNVMETDPLQVGKVYAITLKTPADRTVDKNEETSPIEEKWDLIPMVMINGQMYYDTGKESTIEARCGVMDGKIETTVESWEKPTQNNQSNFGAGYEYQYGLEGTIDIVINDKWITFEALDGDGSTIQFNGKFYDKSKLSEATLKWLELSEEEKMLSSYYPSDLLDEGGFADLDNKQEEWGIELLTENVSPSGLTIVCNQSGDANISELNTGSYYTIQKLENNGYVDVEYLPQEYDVAWTSEAWIIQKESTTKWDVNWGWLYGKLPAGEYRIGKEIMNFRGPGDFEKEMIYAHFEIK